MRGVMHADENFFDFKVLYRVPFVFFLTEFPFFVQPGYLLLFGGFKRCISFFRVGGGQRAGAVGGCHGRSLSCAVSCTPPNTCSIIRYGTFI